MPSTDRPSTDRPSTDAPSTDAPSTDALGEDEIQTLQLLGAGALAIWSRLPRDVQRDLFRSAFQHAVPDLAAPDARMVREALARLLHDHKDDAQRADERLAEVTPIAL